MVKIIERISYGSNPKFFLVSNKNKYTELIKAKTFDRALADALNYSGISDGDYVVVFTYDDGTTSFSKDNADDYAVFTYDVEDNKYYWVKKDGSRIKVR